MGDGRGGRGESRDTPPKGVRQDRENGGVDAGTMTGGKRGWGWGH